MNGVRSLKIRVNDREIDFSGLTLEDLMDQLKLKTDRLVVERNGKIVRRNIYNKEKLNNGDVLEIVRLVGGG